MPTNLNQVYKTSSLARTGTTLSLLRGTPYDIISTQTWSSGSATQNVSTVGTNGAGNWSSYASRSIQVTATNGFLSNTLSTNLTTNYTIMMRFYVDTLPATNAVLCNIGNIGSGGNGVTVVLNSAGNYAIVFQNVAGEFGSGTIAAGTWYHFAVTRGTGAWKMYLDGISTLTSATTSYTPNTPSLVTYLGFSAGFPGPGLLGRMTEAAIFTEELSATTIAAYANAPFI